MGSQNGEVSQERGVEPLHSSPRICDVNQMLAAPQPLGRGGSWTPAGQIPSSLTQPPTPTAIAEAEPWIGAFVEFLIKKIILVQPSFLSPRVVEVRFMGHEVLSE